MKQHITVEQLEFEIDDKSKEKIRNWWKPRVGDKYAWEDGWTIEDGSNWNVNVIDEDGENKDELPWLKMELVKKYPLLSIGQMIEFLEEQGTFNMDQVAGDPPKYDLIWELSSNNEWIDIGGRKEITDSLWEAVKEVLNEM